MKRSFTHIDDVISGILALLQKRSLGYELYNLGGEEATSLLDFIKMIEKKIGKKSVMNLLPIQAGDVSATIADTSKAFRDLGYRPCAILKKESQTL